MTLLTIAHGDATAPPGPEPKIIAHVCNDIGVWGRGFVAAVSARWPEPEAAYRTWYRAHDRVRAGLVLGAVQLVPVDNNLWVANMIGQHGIRARIQGGPPIRYDAVEQCLTTVTAEAIRLGATVHMPRIGCGLAGGTWDRIEPIINRTLTDAGVPVTIYDL